MSILLWIVFLGLCADGFAEQEMRLSSTRHVRETVQGLAASWDGHTVGRALSDGVVLGTPQGSGRFLKGLDGDFLSVAMDAPGRVLAAGDREGTVWFWDMKTHSELGRFAGGHRR